MAAVTDQADRLTDDNTDEFDRRMMLRAIRLARRGEGRVEPNPMVGCVIVRSGSVIAEGSHRRFGGPHAEVAALAHCTRSPRGATAYVSLEPCCHVGKTPPCCDALIDAGLARVVVAVGDPNPEVNGRGIRRLREAGIRVDEGICAAESAEVLAPVFTCRRLGRPYVIAKWAQSLDGRVATKRGDSRWISCPQSRREVHRLRARVDAILVGSGTAKADDPLLTARDVPIKRVARRVVVDGRLRTSMTSQLVTTAKRVPTLVLTSADRAKSTKARRLESSGVEIAACRARSGRWLPEACLAALLSRGVTNVLIEGGPEVLTSFFKADLVDEARVFVAPILVGGGPRHSAIADLGVGSISDALSPVSCATRRVGVDTLHEMRFHDSPVA